MASDAAATSPPLHAHRLIGAGTSAALVTNDGVVDWWCAPRFDSPPLLWSLLDPCGASARWLDGRFVDADPAPAGPSTTTIVEVDGARVTLRDGIVAIGSGLALVRLVRADGSPRSLRHHLRLGGFDASPVSWADGRVGAHAVAVVGGRSTVVDGALVTAVDAEPGRWQGFAIVVGAVTDVDLDALVERLGAAERTAARADRRASLPTQHRERVLDALAVIDACTFDPTGAVVASPTTSVPESPGGTRQFDYRYSWMRDAALAVSLGALMGRRELADRYLAFATEHVFDRGDPCPCPVVAVDGEPVPDEREVSGVAGWAASTPVRVGNAAREQTQFDAWGLLCDAAWELRRAGGDVMPKTLDLVGRLADSVSESRREPTHGIWELREPQDLVAADIGRWIVLDRALRFARRGAPWARRARRWRAARRDARDRVLAAVRPDGFVPQTYAPGDGRVDASALMAVVHGLIRRRDPRARRVVEHTIRALEEGPWLRRYVPPVDDDFAGTEGAFVPASWWAVEALAAIGDVDAAQRRADDLCARSPRLVSEEVDAATDVMLGNTPLVWSHVGMARALYAIDAARRRRRYGPAGDAAWKLRVRLSGRWRRR